MPDRSVAILQNALSIILIMFVLVDLAKTAYPNKIQIIHWNLTNTMFQTDTVIDINGGNHPWQYDQVNIVCPNYKAGAMPSVPEKYIIYSVSKEEYESCRITQSSPKIVALCNKPEEERIFTITFRSFTPTPGGLEFRPGQDYYFISTSSKTDMYRRVGGGCSTNNMKVIFRVAPEPQQLDNDNHVELQSNDNYPMSMNANQWGQKGSMASTRYYHASSRSHMERRRPKNRADRNEYDSIRREASVMHEVSNSSPPVSCVTASSAVNYVILVLLSARLVFA